MKKYICYLSLGANLGQREQTIRRALELLGAEEHIQVVAISSMYETPPWGKLDQPAFINAAAQIETTLEPLELLHTCQKIEKALGRVRHEHWGARTIDLDLLYIIQDGEILHIQNAELNIPHPYMEQRSFVLVPLSELVPELVLDSGRTVAEARDMLPDRDEIEKQEQASSCGRRR